LTKKIVVATGGGFDPLHIGHLKLLREARELGDKLQVWLTSDEWLIRKKGYFLLPYEHRKAVLEALPFVDEVEHQIDDGSLDCSASIKHYKPDILAKGGDYNIDALPKWELEACAENNVKVMYGIGGYDKSGSSSEFFRDAVNRLILHARGGQ